MEKKYNVAQKKAISFKNGPALVVAGAGTGKTAVITGRIIELIKSGIKAEQILALTFTDKAAAEMQNRVDLASPIGYIDSTITTFHSFCADILRRYGIEIGISADFNILMPYQSVVVMQSVVNSLNLKYYKPQSNPYSFVSSLLGFISSLKDEGITTEQFSKFIKRTIDKKIDKPEKQRLQELAMLYTNFEEACTLANCLDYGDLLIKCLKLFTDRPEVLKYFRQQYSYILVDEYQDTNFVQNEILKLLSGKQQNLFVVGDDDQSIYRFRGAAISNILKFVNDFKSAKQFVLNTNYRSNQAILDASYGLIQNNNPYRLEEQNKISKKLIGLKKGKNPEFYFEPSIADETKLVAEKITKFINSGIKAGDIAILLRKNNQAEAFTHALDQAGVAYELGQNKNLFEQPLIRSLINLIKVVNDPNDSQALYVVLCSDLYKVPIHELIDLSSSAYKSKISLEEYISKLDNVSTKVVSAMADILSMREDAVDKSGGQILYNYLEKNGLLNHLVQSSENDNNAVLDLQYLSQFFGLIKDYEISDNNNNMNGLYMYFELMHHSDVDITAEISPLDRDAVKILTVHKAKGLEFEVVFLVDMVEQTFPATKRGDPIRLPEGLISKEELDVNWHILEERRLFYVAMTRAKKQLIMTASADHGGKRAKKPSRFIAEALGNKVLPKNKLEFANKVELKNIPIVEIKTKSKFNPLGKYIDEQGWLHLSANQVADYLRSPKEFWYFDVLNLPKGPFHSLIYGSAMHLAIEHFYNARIHNSNISLNEVINIFENAWRSEGFVSAEHEASRLKNGKQILKRFYKENYLSKDMPRWVEKSFTLRIPELKMVIRGRYDAVFDRNGQIEIRDFKTGNVADLAAAQKRLKDSVQMGIYSLAWHTISGKSVNSLSLNFLEDNILSTISPPPNANVLKLLKKVKIGIEAADFKSPGQSRIKFERLIA